MLIVPRKNTIVCLVNQEGSLSVFDSLTLIDFLGSFYFSKRADIYISSGGYTKPKAIR